MLKAVSSARNVYFHVLVVKKYCVWMSSKLVEHREHLQKKSCLHHLSVTCKVKKTLIFLPFFFSFDDINDGEIHEDLFILFYCFSRGETLQHSLGVIHTLISHSHFVSSASFAVRRLLPQRAVGCLDWLIYLDRPKLDPVVACFLLPLDRQLHDVISKMVSGYSQHIFPISNTELMDYRVNC